ncbi:HHLA2 protein, partial [Amia calva]|nr:HHLA2 protein [Amia calva]
MVTCFYSRDCLLPCEFPSGNATVIHWLKRSIGADIRVHSYYNNQNQLKMQDPQYSGRTQLFSDQLAKGNASLLLKRVHILDRGQYQCYTTTDLVKQEALVVMKVEAPIKSPTIEFRKQSGYNEVVCKSTEVFPAPHVGWSVVPEVKGNLKYSTTKKPNKEGLYNVESKLKIPDRPSNHTYICAINSTSRQHKWKISLTEQVIEGFEGRNLTIPCSSPGDNLENVTLTWSFRNSSTFLKFNSRTKKLVNDWKEDTQLDMQSLYHGNGSLVLVNPKISKHTGRYACRIEATERLHLIQTDVVIGR